MHHSVSSGSRWCKREAKKKKEKKKTSIMYCISSSGGQEAMRLMGNVLQVNEQMQMSEAEG